MTLLPALLASLFFPWAAAAGLGSANLPPGPADPGTRVAPEPVGDFTPDGGPEVNFVGADVSFTNVEAGQTMTCETMNFAGVVVDPGVPRAFGATMGQLGELSTGGCTNPLSGTIEVTLVGSPTVSIVGPPTGTKWPADLHDVVGRLDVAGCSFTVAGSVEGVFDTATQVVTPTDNTFVVADEPVGYMCALVGLEQGQTFDVDGTWQNTGANPLALATS